MNSGIGPESATSTCRRGQRDAPLGALPALVHRERDLVAVDGGDGPVEDRHRRWAGSPGRRRGTRPRRHRRPGSRMATGSSDAPGLRRRCRRIGRCRVRGDRPSDRRHADCAESDGERERDDADDGEPADPDERAAGLSDGRVVLLVGHDVLLDPRRHAGETRVGNVVRMDRVGSVQPVDRIGSGRDAHSPAPFHVGTVVCPSHQSMSGWRPDISGHPAKTSANARARWRRMATAFGVIPRTAAIGLVAELLPGDEAQDLLVGR